MIKRILAIVLIVLGLAAGAVGVLSATAWRSSDTVTASLPQDPEASLLVVQPGVLDVVDDEVTVHAQAADADARVVLVVARDIDVAGWVGDAPYTSVTGLSEWTTLAATEVAGEEQELPDPAVSDMWFIVQEGTGEATLEWTVPEGRWVLLAATDGAAPAPSIDLTWPQDVTTPFFLPCLIGGGVLLLAGLAWLAAQLLGARRRRRAADVPVSEDAASAAGSSSDGVIARIPLAESGAAATTATSGPVDGLTDTALTRRQLREAAAAEAAAKKRRGRRRNGDEAPAALPAAPTAADQDADTTTLPALTDAGASEPPRTDEPSSYPSWMQEASGAEPAALTFPEETETPAAPAAATAAEQAAAAAEEPAEEPRTRRRLLGRRRAKDAAPSEEAVPGGEARAWDPDTWSAPPVGAAPDEGAPTTEIPSVADDAERQEGSDDAADENGRASGWRRAWGLGPGAEGGDVPDAGRTDDEEGER